VMSAPDHRVVEPMPFASRAPRGNAMACIAAPRCWTGTVFTRRPRRSGAGGQVSFRSSPRQVNDSVASGLAGKVLPCSGRRAEDGTQRTRGERARPVRTGPVDQRPAFQRKKRPGCACSRGASYIFGARRTACSRSTTSLHANREAAWGGLFASFRGRRDRACRQSPPAISYRA
jgi:hypothetical protein